MSTEGGELRLRLKVARDALDLTQAELAELAGVATNTLKQYESGRIRPGADPLAGYARAGVNIRYLLLGEGEPLESANAYPSLEGKRLTLHIDEGAESWRGEIPVSRVVELMLTIATEIECAEKTVGANLSDAKRQTVTQNLLEECLESGTVPRSTTVLRFIKAAG